MHQMYANLVTQVVQVAQDLLEIARPVQELLMLFLHQIVLANLVMQMMEYLHAPYAMLSV
jgi:hypothetical protein